MKRKGTKYPSNYIKAARYEGEYSPYTSAHWEAVAEFSDGTSLTFNRPYTVENGNYEAENEQQYNIECELFRRADALGKEIEFYSVNFVGEE